MKITWYFDYISPYSWIQWARQVPRLEGYEIELVPVLFAGLLKNRGQKGPAEIPEKRRFTYRHVVWLAGRLNVPLTMPSAHPFNPLPLLRLSITRGSDPGTVDRLFGFVWRDGHIPADTDAWQALAGELGFDEAALREPSVKQTLLGNGERALAAGVFGVPTFVAGGEVFWGVDGFDFLLDYLADPDILTAPVMRAADAVPQGV